MTKPEISIITPNYNSAKYLPETIKSVLNQTYKNWEWLIVDDASTDNSIKVIQSIPDDRIKLISLTQNSGAAIARNKALDCAQGRYITFLDSDDIWLPNFLEITLTILQKEKIELVYASYHRLDENLQPFLPDFIVPEKVDFQRLLYNCPIPMLTAVYDSKRIGKIPIPKNSGKREDYAMWLDVLKKIPFAYGIQQPLAIYRIRKNSYSRNKWEMAKNQFFIYYSYLKLGLPVSLYYTFFWALNGLKKYKIL